ncbi:hypothetical protein [Paenibacillus sp. YYML68]|nr:hypothetical protein [Paenibacillus sp. YYML68]
MPRFPIPVRSPLAMRYKRTVIASMKSKVDRQLHIDATKLHRALT